MVTTTTARLCKRGVTALLIVLLAGSGLGRFSGIPTALAQGQSTPPNQAVLHYDRLTQISQPTYGQGGMVASDQILASSVGAQILRRGGNAVDAAVATGFALAVVLPYAGNLGGGGFMLIHQHDPKHTVALDFREVAPQAAHPDMFLDSQGQVIPNMSTESTASVGVPGSVAGLLLALEQYGSLSQRDVIEPAIQLAREGFEVSHELARMLESHRLHLAKSPASRMVFFVKRNEQLTCALVVCPIEDIRTLQAGERLVQEDLAHTLELIAQNGRDGFYKGPVAQAILATLNHDRPNPSKAEPLFTLEDLTQYRAQWRKPIWGHYQGAYAAIDVASMPPPSSGGIHLIQILNMLEHIPFAQSGWGSAQAIHDLTQVAKLAYADRAQHLGDTDFITVPIQGLISKEYAKQRMQGFDRQAARASQSIQAGDPLPYESDQTTHYSVIDRHGNMVSTTTTLNLNFGSGWMAQGTGVLLNNEMDDFAIKAGVPNAFGLVGSQANAIAPGKRPLSSMTPTLVFKAQQPWFATGTPGGARIITTVVQHIVNVVDFNMNLAQAAAAPRMHHQWLPDFIRLEQGFSPDTIALLRAKGHDVRVMGIMGRVQAVEMDRSDPQNSAMMQGVSDPRSPDGAAISVRP